MDGLSVFVLAGGRGTRLSTISGGLPKPLMPVGGQPFLRRHLQSLAASGLTECVLCLGYAADSIIQVFSTAPIEGLRLIFSVEAEPRGTAGALRAAEPWWGEQNLVLNGDTEIAFDLAGFYTHHCNWEADVTIGLAAVDDAARFGRVLVARDGRLRAFFEKDDVHTAGLVNAGVYLCSRRALSLIPATGYASIERDWLPLLLERGLAVYAIEVATHFTDIGTPEDYWRLANQG